MKIFWSWQSDNHQESGRYFVRDVLNDLADELNNVGSTEEADRPDGNTETAESSENSQVKVDHDTQGVGGSPPIADTILRKIREAAVFVADVTPVGTTKAGKRLTNPNVMIELGYAMKVLGHERIVLVMNRAEGASLKLLPFDLRHWRAPVSYSLHREATDDQRAEVAKNLKQSLNERILPSLKHAEQALRENRRSTHRAPELRVKLGKSMTAPIRISQVVTSLAVPTLDEVRKKTPIRALPTNPPHRNSLESLLLPRALGLPGTKIRRPFNEWTLEEVEGYNRVVAGYYLRYEKYLEELGEFKLLQHRSFLVECEIFNGGTLRANQIKVSIEFPDWVTLFEEDKTPKAPEPPEPPPLAPIGDGFVTARQLHTSLSHFDLSYPHEVEIDNALHTASFSLTSLAHGYSKPLDKFIASILDASHIRSFSARVTVTADELLDPAKGTLNFEVHYV